MADQKDKTDNLLRQVLIVTGLFLFPILLIARSVLPAKADDLSFIEKVRVGLHPDTVRIVLTLDRRPDRPVLSGTTTARPSVGLIGVMPGAGVHRSLVVRTPSFRKYLSEINISYEPSDRTTRLSLRFVHPVPPPKVFILSSPHRIVMDFAISGEKHPGEVQKSSPGKHSRKIVIPGKPLPSALGPSYKPLSPHSAPSGSVPSVEKSRPPLLASGFPASGRPFRVVLDAGHGGRDCGTTSLSGICEKTLVLDIVKRLRKILDRDPRFQVILTRTDDHFVSLPDRTRIANESHGDLFLSVHANADPDPGVRGLETFLLNLHSSDARAQRIAQRENSALGVSRGDLSAILLTLKINHKKKRSWELAQEIDDNLAHTLGTNYPVRNLGIRQAPFYVIMGTTMPAVLTEVNFLSNKTDARLMDSSRFREETALALYRGIVAYYINVHPESRIPVVSAKLARQEISSREP